ncbi:MAG: type IV toxin-antitoxin system AbiEi family antitoxin domain-containing protein [Armatimonadota bacterium]
MRMTRSEELIELARRAGVVRARDLAASGIPRSYLRRLCDQGLLIRTGRGIYVPAEGHFSEHHSLAEACKRVPHGVVCLSSALRFHELTTQDPWDVWLMIESRARVPSVDHPPLRIFRSSGRSFTAGVEEHLIEGVPVRIYCLPKTIADCFKFRNKIGLDVALEALRECLRSRRCSRDELHEFARINRVERVMQPYLEALS